MDAYIYAASLLCSDCSEQIRKNLTADGLDPTDPTDESTLDSDDWPCGPIPDGGGEADCPQHCDQCGEFLENPLTSDGIDDGIDYVETACREAINANQKDSVALNVWAPFYEITLKPEDEE